MIFTREDILKILNALLQLGRKDSEFKDANTPLNSDDEIAILQDGINKKVSINNLLSSLGLLKKDDFINVSDRYDEYYIQLSEAVTIIAKNKRKNGLVITFLDLQGNWKIYQFNGLLSDFIDTNYWKDLFDFKYPIIDSILPDEEDLTLTYPDDSNNSFIKFKDKSYDSLNFSGMAVKTLRKNIEEINGKRINILRQDDFDQENCIYEIKYDFNLGSGTIVIPNNCILDFSKGGSLYNGYVKGPILNDYVDVEWFIPKSYDYDLIMSFKYAIYFANFSGKRLEIHKSYDILTDQNVTFSLKTSVNFNNHKITVNTTGNTFSFLFKNDTIEMEEVAKGALLKALINNIFTIDDPIFSQEEVNSLSKYRNTFVHLSIAPEHYSPEYIETQRLKEDQSINYFQELIYIGAINSLTYVKYNNVLPDDVSLYKFTCYNYKKLQIENVNLEINSAYDSTIPNHFKSLGINIVGYSVDIINTSIDGSNIENKNVGLIYLLNCYLSKLYNVNIILNRNTSSTYALNMVRCYEIKINNINILDYNNKYWGHTITTICYFLTITNSNLGRVDSHYRGFYFTITNSTITLTCSFMGGGTLIFDNIICYAKLFLRGREDMSSEFNGDIYINRLLFVNVTSPTIISLRTHITDYPLHPNNDSNILCTKLINISNVSSNIPNTTITCINLWTSNGKLTFPDKINITNIDCLNFNIISCSNSKVFLSWVNQSSNLINKYTDLDIWSRSISINANTFIYINNVKVTNVLRTLFCDTYSINTFKTYVELLSLDDLNTIIIPLVYIENSYLCLINVSGYREKYHFNKCRMFRLDLNEDTRFCTSLCTEININDCLINADKIFGLLDYEYLLINNSVFSSYNKTTTIIYLFNNSMYLMSASDNIEKIQKINIRNCVLDPFVEKVFKDNISLFKNLTLQSIKIFFLTGHLILSYTRIPTINISEDLLKKVTVLYKNIPCVFYNNTWKLVALTDIADS